MTSTTFGRGAPPARQAFEAGLLPLEQKEDLCRNLLAEFGVTNIRHRASKHELTHACLIDPSHTRQDSEPTASLNYKKLTYKCLGCQASGGLLWFIAQCRHESTVEARRWVAQKVGLDGTVMEVADLMRYFDALYASEAEKVPIPVYSSRMLEPWALIHPYLTDSKEEGGRGIPEQNVIDMKVGYAQDYLVGKRPDDTWITSERIVLPHFWKGDLVGWQTRRLADDGTSKFLSSPDFPHDQTIYNYQPTNETAVVVEAMLSVISHMHAITNMEATFGGSVTDTQIRLLAKHPTVILFMDNDRAGWKATEKMANELGRSSNVCVVENPYAADPGDMTTPDVLELTAMAVPYSIWQRPKMLLCYQCKDTAHEGLCHDD